MQTSDKGRAALLLEEGDVLRAYRDVAGVWTISGGLTAASGVVKPRAGMVITQEESARLMSLALTRNYEPAVAAAMPQAAQHEFDAGISFHFNTGAIARASWVKAWRAKGARAEIRDGLMAWRRAAGRVLPALEARRAREAAMLLDATYRQSNLTQSLQGMAKWGLSMSVTEIGAVRDGFGKLGYDAGPNPAGVLLETARKFQVDHALTADGIIGRATLSTLQRRLDARSQLTKTTVAGLPAAAAPATVDQLADVAWIAPLIWFGLALYVASLVWRYRDAVAAKIARISPRLAILLRSF